MKKAKIEIEINVPNDFEPGDCKKCPYESEEGTEKYYGHYTVRHYCAIGFGSTTCPIEVCGASKIKKSGGADK